MKRDLTIKVDGRDYSLELKVVIIAIICIFLLECIALFSGFNGVLLKTAFGLIFGLVGLALPRPKLKKIKELIT